MKLALTCLSASCIAAFDNDCSVPEENLDFAKCDAENENKLFECLRDCERSDAVCASDCNRKYVENFENCPCQANCQNGCPCSDYDCNYSAIFVLNTFDPDNKPVVISGETGETRVIEHFAWGLSNV